MAREIRKDKFPILDELERLLGKYGDIGIHDLMLRLERTEAALDKACWDLANEGESNPVGVWRNLRDEYLANRPSDTPAQGSAARPGVGNAVESKTVDEKGLASRVEELENLIAKRSGCSRCNDSASGSKG